MCDIPATNITMGTEKPYFSVLWPNRIKGKVGAILILGSKLDNLLGCPGGDVEANRRVVVIGGVQAYSCHGIKEANECDAHLAPQVRFQKDVHEMSRSCCAPAKAEDIHSYWASGEAGDHGADLGEAFL
ncbi:hypothetical protein D3C79_743210 [compost metagenome]